MANILGKDGNDADIYIESSRANTDLDPAASHETVANAIGTNTTAIASNTTAIGNLQTALVNAITALQSALTAALPGKTSAQGAVTEVTTSSTVLLEHILTPRDKSLVVEVINSGATALNLFQVENRAHANSGWQPIENSAADWANPLPTDGRVAWSDGNNPFTLAGATTARFELTRISPWQAIRFTATVASGSTDIQVRIGGGE